MNQAGYEQYIEFIVHEEAYAIKIHDVDEIIKMQNITETPNCTDYIKGVINLRGKIVPVISLRLRFNKAEEAYTKATRIIVVNQEKDSVGIIVDKVVKVTTYANMQPPPERIGVVQGSYLTGIGVDGEQLVGLLKLDQVLCKP